MNDSYPFFKNIAIGLSLAFIFSLIRYFFFDRKDELEADEMMKKNYQRHVKKVLNEREKRKVAEKLFDEKDFWRLIEDVKIRSKENFRNHVGLLKDIFSAMEAEDLLKFQGSYLVAILKANTYKVAGAFYIISNSVGFYSFDHFKEWLLSKGQVYFNNYIENPELIVNANINSIDSEGIYTALSEVYYHKTGKLLPEAEDYEDELKGDKIEERDIPDMYPNLWRKFFVN